MGETDRELLEKAARAAGLEFGWIHSSPRIRVDVGWTPWNPLTDDGNALRLAVNLGLGVAVDKSCSWAHPLDRRLGMDWSAIEEHCSDPYAATRRAVVRAAAALAATPSQGEGRG